MIRWLERKAVGFVLFFICIRLLMISTKASNFNTKNNNLVILKLGYSWWQSIQPKVL